MKRIFAIVAVVGLPVAASASPILTTYSTQAQFLAATTGGAGLGFDNFDHYPLSSTHNTILAIGPDAMATIGAGNVGAGSAEPNAIRVVSWQGGNAIRTNSNFADGLRVQFSTGITAMGANIMDGFVNDDPTDFDIVIVDSENTAHLFQISVPRITAGFFGFTVSGGSVDLITFTASMNGVSNIFEAMDNLYWGNHIDNPVIPLPSAGLAGLAGLVVVGGMRRRPV